jgi:hypothetical protein
MGGEMNVAGFYIKIVAIPSVCLAMMGCGNQGAKVSGQVTCQGNPVMGSILFSPKGEDEGNTGPAVTALLNEDGHYQLRLKTVGKHTVVVTPRDVKFPVRPGEFDYPCDRSPVEREVQTGDNNISLELIPRPK